MRVLHWKWIAVLVIPMFVTILWVSVYHKIGVAGGGNGTTTTTTTTSSSSSSSSRNNR